MKLIVILLLLVALLLMDLSWFHGEYTTALGHLLIAALDRLSRLARN
jgi:hypothetical protein